jgi:hypothetical protein
MVDMGRKKKPKEARPEARAGGQDTILRSDNT